MTRRKDPRTARRPVRDLVAQGGELPAFTPVPRRCRRHDGWTPARQRGFIEELADLGSVEAAARAVDMSSVGAYQLRRQPGAEEFRKAWEAALQLGVQRIEDVTMDRALNGVEEPLYSYGKFIGTRTRYNDRLLMFILRNRAPERFAAGGGARAMNALDQQQLAKLHKQWEKEYLAKQRKVSIEEVKASIDRKVEAIRARFRREVESRWAALSEETRAAWAHFIELRDRDLDAMDADARTRELLDPQWDDAADHFDPPEPPALPAPRTGAAQEEDWHPPEGWRKEKAPPPPPKTSWSLKDDNFDP